MTGRALPIPLARVRVVALAAAVLFGIAWFQVRAFIADDTFIHLTYAKHVRDGQGLVFNLGERVYGTTSPLWSLALGWLGWTGVDLLLLAKVLSTFFGLGAVLVGSLALHRLLSRWTDRYDVDPRVARLAWGAGTLAWAVDVWLVRWSASGMESSLGAFLVVGGFVAYFRGEPWGSSTRAPAWWWATASLIRPEVCLLVGLLAMRGALEPGRVAAKLRLVAEAVLPAALLGGAWLAYAAVFYGTVVPATFASKAAEQTPFFQNLFIQMKELGADRGVEIVALLAVLPILAPRLLRDWREHFVPLGWLAGLPLFYASTHVLGITRYLMPLTPLVVCYGWGSIAYAASLGTRRGAARASRFAVVGAALVAIGGNAFVFARHVVPQARAFERVIHETLIPTAQWFRAHTAPGTQVAIEHVGVFGYYAERRIVDLSGLVTPQLTPLLADYGYDRVMLEFRFATRARPDYLIDVDTESRRMLAQSAYASCLDLLEEKPYDYMSIRRPGRGFLTVYRVDWTCFDARFRPPS